MPITKSLALRIITGVILAGIVGFVIVQGGLIFTIACALIFGVGLVELRNLITNTQCSAYMKFLLMVLGGIYIGFALVQFDLLRKSPDGMIIVGFLITIVALCDVGGLIFGRLIGGPLLAPVISPKKTWSGLVGCCLFSCMFLWMTMAAGWWALGGIMQGQSLMVTTGVVVAIVLSSQVGDLLESWLKRKAAAKDSGAILPGHGGILDRIDGHIAGIYAANALIFSGLWPNVWAG